MHSKKKNINYICKYLYTKDQDRMLAIDFPTWDLQNPTTTLNLIYM